MVKPSLQVKLAGVKLENPLMNASGILGLTSYSLVRLAEAGLGALVTKSIGLEARLGSPNPTVVEVPVGLINSMGLPNPGLEAFKAELEEALARIRKPLFVSVFGFNPREYGEAVRRLEGFPVAGFELNVSCPHVGGVGEIGGSPEALEEAVKGARASTEKPLLVKLSPNLSSFAEAARLVEKAGADGIVATNTIRAMVIDLEAGRPLLAGVYGGLSGPALKPVALRCVYEAYEAVKIPIVGCGGIFTWRDALEYFMAGASAIQVGTALAYQGLEVFRSLLSGLSAYLEEKRIEDLSGLVGVAHKR
jgi:dihydroorotate dehydrogenase (NAD+) catalytic subunit